jgi:GT2 family glycosyltransferase
VESTSYDKWIAANEPSLSALKAQHTKANNFSYKPLISLIMPVWNTPKEILKQTISSVLQQTYGNWELCMVDANSDPDTKKVLSYWSKKDRRIRIKFLDENKGIAVNSDEALSLAQGEFVAFLDHDDLLAPFALFEVVNRLQIDMTADVIYSDEDKIDESGRRFDPFFKPGFSPDYLRSVNYMPHFLVVRKSLGDQVAWFREGYDGAQDYDLILRAVEKAKSVVHIPKVLYHWRAWTSSTAGGTDAKPYANTSGKKALQEHLTRVGLSAQVEDGSYSTFYRARYQLNNNPLISIIIPNQDHALDLEQCVNSIFQKTTYPNFEIILVENGSKEQATFNLYKRFEKDTRIHLIEWNKPFNYSRINNWAAAQANGEVILFLNNDIQAINGDWLEQMLQFAIRQDVGAVGAKLYYPDESIQHAGVIVGVGGIAGHSHKNYSRKHAGYFGRLVSVQNVSAVTAACMMIRKQVLQEVNGFDENYILAFGDVDLCLRILQKGYLNVWTPYAELYHHESKTRGYEDTSKKIKRFNKEIEYFKQKWSDFLQKGDPYYNPNLTLEREDFSINPNPVNVSVRIKPGFRMDRDGHK